MATPALPIALAQYAPDYVPRAEAARVIPRVFQPSFGIRPNAVLPGATLAQNAFYNPSLAYFNTQLVPLPPVNMPANQYLGYLPGLSRAPAP